MRKFKSTLIACALMLPLFQPAQASSLLVMQIGPVKEKTSSVPEAVQIGEGIKAFFESANAKGGINGDKIVFSQIDDAGDPDQFVQKFSEIVKNEKPLAVFSPFGSPTIQKILQTKVLDRSDTFVLDSVASTDALRNGSGKFLHLRATESTQLQYILHHMKTIGFSQLGVIYVDTPSSTSGLADVNKFAKEKNVQVSMIKSEPNETAIKKAAETLQKNGVQCALIFGPNNFIVSSIKNFRNNGFYNPIYSLSHISGESLFKEIGKSARNVIISEAFPNPMGNKIPLQREFQNAMKVAFPNIKQYSPFHLEGYISAKLFAEATQRTKTPSSENILASLKKMGPIDLGGFQVDFSRSTTGSNFVELGVVNDSGKLMY